MFWVFFRRPGCREVSSGSNQLLYKMDWVHDTADIDDSPVEDFIFKDIVCRFGVPNIIITDNGKQFDNGTFWSFSET